ncbi:hypothetical protein F2Q69_00042263 [Brassica cretica]|uniref:Uncharacterized protein n=1 Tax=Brassica cretica TaxID=69181 RepID=A0A8S9NFA2_BRACR|nr:hypothetical protein F2Q69_00042263 [Brassica cretica]
MPQWHTHKESKRPMAHRGCQSTNVKTTCIKTLRATRYKEHMELENGQLPSGRMRNPNRVPKIKEVKTSVQPRAHRGHYNFKEPPGSNQQSPDPNIWVPTRPRRPNTILEKKDRTHVQPRAHQDRYIPKGPPGSHTTSGSIYTRVTIRSPDQREKPCILIRPTGPITETSRFQPRSPDLIRESPDSYIASGPQSRSQDLEKRPPGLDKRPCGLTGTSGSQTRSKDPRRAYAPPSPMIPGSSCNLRITRSFSRLQETMF